MKRSRAEEVDMNQIIFKRYHRELGGNVQREQKNIYRCKHAGCTFIACTVHNISMHVKNAHPNVIVEVEEGTE